MPNLIHLKDYSDVYDLQTPEYNYIKSEATRSRLMGVIGIRIIFEEVTLYYHLDFEEYGLDRFEVTDYVSESMTAAVMGGLGESLVEISLDEATALIYDAIDVGERYAYEVPISFFEYEYLLHDEFKTIDKALLQKISSKMTSDHQLIHYYLMRTAGLDHVCKKLLLQEGNFDFEFIDEPTVLLKNEIIPYEDEYISKSIIDYYDAYKMVVTKIKIKDNAVVSCELVEDLVMTPKEAAFQLNKKEYIFIFYVASPKAFKMSFETPSMIRNEFESGVLLTDFNKDNNHTTEEVYYLNGDIRGSFYITGHQLVVTCFDYKNLMTIKKQLVEDYKMDEVAELEAENPILNRFIRSGSEDFFDFLGE